MGLPENCDRFGYSKKNGGIHLLPRRQIATNVPEENRESGERNRLIIHKKNGKEPKGEGEAVKSNPSGLT
jgi:hypothetical protein